MLDQNFHHQIVGSLELPLPPKIKERENLINNMFDYIFHVLYRNHVEENKTVPVTFIESLFSVNFGRFEQTFRREPLVPNIIRKI